MQADKEKKEKRIGGRRAGGISRPIAIAIALVVAGAAFLFWPRGGGRSAGIGEQYSVVTAASQQSDGLTDGPRSGDVSIEDEVPDLVPEKATTQDKPTPQKKSQPDDSKQTAVTSQTGQDSAVKKDEAKPKPAVQSESSTAAKPPPPPPLQPQSRGGWALQVGAFTSSENAQKQLDKLSDAGYAPIMQTSNTADNSMLYRVWIGYFQTRQDAQTYARQHRSKLGDGLPVHR